MSDSINKNKNMPVKWTPFVDHIVPATLGYDAGQHPAKFTMSVVVNKMCRALTNQIDLAMRVLRGCPNHL